jgi:hypothetical protein
LPKLKAFSKTKKVGQNNSTENVFMIINNLKQNVAKLQTSKGEKSMTRSARIIALFLVLVLLCSFASCNTIEDQNIETTDNYITSCPIPEYYSDLFDAYIDTWKREYTEEDNFFIVEGKDYSDILLIPRIEGYEPSRIRLSTNRDYYFVRASSDPSSITALHITILVEREEKTLVDYLIGRGYIKDASELVDDMYYRNRLYYINVHGLNIRVDLPVSCDEFKSKEELLGFLNFEVMYPYDEASEATSTT